jgi:glycerophosphoryl diester phosphodiesterase
VTAVLAHRGASRRERENTLAAFRTARELGAPWVEFDVRLAADGTLVVHHDPEYPDGRAVALTPGGQRPDHVPLLAEALAACAGMRVNVEIKNSADEAGFDPTWRVAGATADAIGDAGWRDRVLVSCFDRPTLTAVRAADPGLPTALLTSAVPVDAAERDRWLAGLAADGHVALHPWWPLVDADVVAACHRHGLAVNVWTCDDPAAMARLAGWGVDGICTNVPDVALAVLADGRVRAGPAPTVPSARGPRTVRGRGGSVPTRPPAIGG